MRALILSPEVLAARKLGRLEVRRWGRRLRLVFVFLAPRTSESIEGNKERAYERVQPVRDEEGVERGKGLGVGHGKDTIRTVSAGARRGRVGCGRSSPRGRYDVSG